MEFATVLLLLASLGSVLAAAVYGSTVTRLFQGVAATLLGKQAGLGLMTGKPEYREGITA